MCTALLGAGEQRSAGRSEFGGQRFARRRCIGAAHRARGFQAVQQLVGRLRADVGEAGQFGAGEPGVQRDDPQADELRQSESERSENRGRLWPQCCSHPVQEVSQRLAVGGSHSWHLHMRRTSSTMRIGRTVSPTAQPVLSQISLNWLR